MKDRKLTVAYNNEIADSVWHMSLEGDCSGFAAPGQFIDILVDDMFLRRPISVFDHDDAHVEILYRVVGRGTMLLSEKVPGDELDVLLPLGNGFDLSKRGKKTLLVAGGIGMPPVHEIAKQLITLNGTDAGNDFRVLLGFRSAGDMFGTDNFRKLGIEPVIATEDGSCGYKGLVTDVMDMMTYDYDYVMCCGPEPMLKAVYEHSPDGQFSFEERMGCGFGACMGCSCQTRYGYKRICKDGPVLFREEIIW
ncbi:MAG: dihydroorotate dehydrogenase electron transfer subunit [Eubacterium sp.]|nr:dihydroorotate dehydrogenase electron transfer subunit [Eubacterium sp.]